MAQDSDRSTSWFGMMAALVAMLIPTSLFLGVVPRGSDDKGGTKSSASQSATAKSVGEPLKPDPRSAVLESMGMDLPTERSSANAAPPGAPAKPMGGEGPKSDRWFPYAPDWRIDFVVASLSDPLDSRLGFYFDGSLAVLEQAAVDAGYILDRWQLPWSEHLQGAKSASGRRLYEDTPGVLVFRRMPSADDEDGKHRPTAAASRRLLVVFVIGETPTAGLHVRALTTALHFIDSHRGQAGLPALDGRLHLVSPYHTGGADSLVRAFRRWTSEREGSTDAKRPTPDVRIYSGGATGIDAKAFKDRCAASGVTAEFHSPLEQNDQALNCLLHHVGEQDLRRPWPSGVFLPKPPVVLLREATTAFGARKPEDSLDVQRAGDAPKAQILEFGFPAHVSAVRTAYKNASPARHDVMGRFEPPRAKLDISTDTAVEPRERPTLFSPNLAGAETETLLHEMLGFVERSQARYVGVVATDVRDRIFLAGLVRERCPNVQVFLPQADLYYLHDSANRHLRGALVASTYPVVPELNPRLQILGGGGSVTGVRLQRSDGDAGRYYAMQRAIREALQEGDSARGVASTARTLGKPGLGSKPPPDPAQWDEGKRTIWISSVGVDRMWPVARYHPKTVREVDQQTVNLASPNNTLMPWAPRKSEIFTRHGAVQQVASPPQPPPPQPGATSEPDAAAKREVPPLESQFRPSPSRWVVWAGWFAMFGVALHVVGREAGQPQAAGADQSARRLVAAALLFGPPIWIALWVALADWRWDAWRKDGTFVAATWAWLITPALVAPAYFPTTAAKDGRSATLRFGDFWAHRKMALLILLVGAYPFCAALAAWRPVQADYYAELAYWRFTSPGDGVSTAEPLMCLGWALLANGWCRRSFGGKVVQIEKPQGNAVAGGNRFLGVAATLACVGAVLCAATFVAYRSNLINDKIWSMLRCATDLCLIAGAGCLVGLNLPAAAHYDSVEKQSAGKPNPPAPATAEPGPVSAEAGLLAAEAGNPASAKSAADQTEPESTAELVVKGRGAKPTPHERFKTARAELDCFTNGESPVPLTRAWLVTVAFTLGISLNLWRLYTPTIEGPWFDYAFLTGFTLTSGLLTSTAVRIYYYWARIRAVLRAVDAMPWSCAFERLHPRAKRHFGRLLSVDPADLALAELRRLKSESCVPPATSPASSSPAAPWPQDRMKGPFTLRAAFRWLKKQKGESPVLPKDAPPDHPDRYRLDVEDAAAIAFVQWINPYLASLRPLFNGVAITSILLIAASASYPFPSSQAVMTTAALIVFAGAALVVSALWQMETDSLLSRANGTQPGELTFDLKLMRALSTALLPVLALVALAFPEVSRTVMLWLEPWLGS